jgi:serine/threonine-protein kinase HipA
VTDWLALDVYQARNLVGQLRFDPQDERFEFTYAPHWLQRPESFALSQHLPKPGGNGPKSGDASSAVVAGFPSGVVRRFLENLLPEGRGLDAVIGAHKIARSNTFGLVRVLGRETAGALSFLPQGTVPEEMPAARRPIAHDELRARIAERSQLPFSVWDRCVRLSIAGYQDKIAVYEEAGEIALVDGALSSTHILKPEPVDPRLPHMVANEHFCLSLAQALGIEAAQASIMRLPEPVLKVQRFDRVRTKEGVERLHILDGCQMLDLTSFYKYERPFGSERDVRDIRDGASLPKLFAARDSSVGPAQFALRLLRWSLFQVLIGNADAHGKNLSCFVTMRGLKLAPAYDLLSAQAYPGVDHTLAMAVGDEFDSSAVQAYDWAVFAEKCRIARPVVIRELKSMAAHAPAKAQTLLTAPHYTPEERDTLGAIVSFLQAQAARFLEAAGLLRDVRLD